MSNRDRAFNLHNFIVLIFTILLSFGLFGLFGEILNTDSVISDDAIAPISESNSYMCQVIKDSKQRSNMVHIGGQMTGFQLYLGGVVVVDFNEVETSVGKAVLKSDLQLGDIIESVEGTPVRSAKEIGGVLNNGEKKSVYNFCIIRNGEKQNITVSPLIEKVSGDYKLGIMVKNDIGGIGTVTFTKQDGRFAALGHAICGHDGKCLSNIEEGKTYDCKVVGLEKGAKGKAGSVKGTINANKMLGTIDKNISYGIYGNFDAPSGELYELASRDEVRPGKAQIRSTVSGEAKFYDIEIIKAIAQNTESEKSMVIKITDKRLLGLTGGIIQGMSGSPIIQNNKIVGAVTHVFIKDPTRGYGLYADWMVGQ